MKKILLVLTIVLACTFAASAQGLLDKIDKALNKVENTSNKVDNASGKAGRIGGKLGGLLGKKGEEAAALTVLIEGVNLGELKKISTGLESNKKVSEVKMKYNAAGSTLTVLFSGDSEALLELLKKTSTLITDETVQSIEEDGIAIKIEK